MSKEGDRAMLREWLARVQHDAGLLDTLIVQDAAQDDLVAALGDLSYATGVVQGGAVLFICRWAPLLCGRHAHDPPP